MEESTKEVTDQKNDGNVGTKKHIKKSTRIFIEIFSILYWIYEIVNSFIFNLNLYIINRYFPELSWLSYLKILVFCIVNILLITITVRKKCFKWLLYFSFYPLVLIFWRIPYFILKQKYWFLAIALLKAIYSFFITFKYSIIMLSLFFISLIFIANVSNKIVLSFSVIIIFCIIFITIINRGIKIFKPSYETLLFKKISPLINKLIDSRCNLDENLKNTPISEYDEKQMKTWTESLQTSVIINRVILFSAKKLRDYKKSNFDLLYFIISMVFLLIFIIVSFSLVNYGVYKIDKNAFIVSNISSPNFFIFFYYSFNTIFYNAILEIVPNSIVSRIVQMSSYFTSFLMITIFIGLFISIWIKKHTNEIDDIVTGLEKKGSDMESMIVLNFNVDNISAAIDELKKAKANLLNSIYFISKYIK